MLWQLTGTSWHWTKNGFSFSFLLMKTKMGFDGWVNRRKLEWDKRDGSEICNRDTVVIEEDTYYNQDFIRSCESIFPLIQGKGARCCGVICGGWSWGMVVSVVSSLRKMVRWGEKIKPVANYKGYESGCRALGLGECPRESAWAVDASISHYYILLQVLNISKK
jgi:hypothetical protein